MLITHNHNRPTVDESAWVAPNAVLCGDVTVGPGCRVLYGAQVVAESGSIVIGRDCIIMENAVLRSSNRHSLTIGDHCLVGPNAHVVGSSIEDEVFIATGASVFHASHLGRGCEIRVNGVVHLKTSVPEGQTVPIGWIAVGEPAQMFPPDQHDRIWEVQKPLNFPLTVYGIDRKEASMKKITRKLSEALSSHREDDADPPTATGG